MTDSRSTRIVCVAGDPARRERIGQALREAGFNVAEASASEEAIEFTRDSSPVLVLRDGRPPVLNLLHMPGSASGEAGAPGQIEIVMSDAAEPAALANVAHALMQLRAAGALFRVRGTEGMPPAADALQAGNSIPAAVRSLCHDLRTPLSAMAGRLHLMQNGKLGEADLKRAIEKLQGNVKDQVQLIDQVLLACDG